MTAVHAPRAGRLVLLLLLVSACAAALVTAATPAHALGSWIHDGAITCDSCHAGGASDASCTSCHEGFASVPGRTCWSCHAPGSDTSALSSSSEACGQECHLYRQLYKDYVTPYEHGADPHLGSAPPYGVCLDCHAVSASPLDPADSPHHAGVAVEAPSCTDCHNGTLASKQPTHVKFECTACHAGMNRPAVPASCTTCHTSTTFGAKDCRSCHAEHIHNAAPNVGTCTSCHKGYQKHSGKVACTKCHASMPKLHHGQSAPKPKTCRSCHAKKHAGKAVANSKCASCHKGKAPSGKPRAQHSKSVTKKYSCGGCHSKPIHAGRSSITCRTCHKGKFHAAQKAPANSICTNCHGSAGRHSGGYRCVGCHRRAVHNRAPRA
jgi:hypothetical protein